MTISYKIEKSPIPIFWIDTSIIIAIARILSGKSNEPSQGKNAALLYDFIHKRVRVGDLLCPRGDQRDEVFKGRSIFRSVDTSLSLGLKFRDRFSIQNYEIRKLMSAFISNENTINLSYLDAFESDPCSDKAVSSRVYTDVDINLIGDISKATAKKRSLSTQMESLRRKNIEDKVSFATQFKDELQGDIIAIKLATERVVQARKEGLQPTFNDLGALDKYQDMYSDWTNISGKQNDTASFEAFLQSEHYQGSPHILISSMLAAKLMTSNSSIEPGDAMDINHASTILPYADVFITDRKKRNMLIDLKLDDKFNCKICYLSDVEDIISEFSAS